ncbi:MAG TPA: CPBP family intramembrane glutamic endopeptidase [Terriglobales bacterium]|nr:CPBP family intramembrane glutamic endopeptidase [Terriglobales bacterium]
MKVLSREFIEVAGVFSLIIIALWTPRYAAIFMIAAAIWILIATLTSPRSASELGVGRIGLRKSVWIAVSGALLAAAILGAGAIEGTLHTFPWLPRPLLHSGVYAVWALVQQFITLSFFFIRFERLLASGTKAVVTTALLFSAVHIPNWVLLVATAMMGLVFAEIFRRYRNIYWLGVAHALLGIALAMALPDALHHQMNVGVAYLSYPGQ